MYDKLQLRQVWYFIPSGAWTESLGLRFQLSPLVDKPPPAYVYPCLCATSNSGFSKKMRYRNFVYGRSEQPQLGQGPYPVQIQSQARPY